MSRIAEVAEVMEGVVRVIEDKDIVKEIIGYIFNMKKKYDEGQIVNGADSYTALVDFTDKISEVNRSSCGESATGSHIDSLVALFSEQFGVKINISILMEIFKRLFVKDPNCMILLSVYNPRYFVATCLELPVKYCPTKFLIDFIREFVNRTNCHPYKLAELFNSFDDTERMNICAWVYLLLWDENYDKPDILSCLVIIGQQVDYIKNDCLHISDPDKKSEEESVDSVNSIFKILCNTSVSVPARLFEKYKILLVPHPTDFEKKIEALYPSKWAEQQEIWAKYKEEKIRKQAEQQQKKNERSINSEDWEERLINGGGDY